MFGVIIIGLGLYMAAAHGPAAVEGRGQLPQTVKIPYLIGKDLRDYIVGHKFAVRPVSHAPNAESFERSGRYIAEHEWGYTIGTYQIFPDQVCLKTPDVQKYCFKVRIIKSGNALFVGSYKKVAIKKVVRRIN